MDANSYDMCLIFSEESRHVEVQGWLWLQWWKLWECWVGNQQSQKSQTFQSGDDADEKVPLHGELVGWCGDKDGWFEVDLRLRV